MQGKSQPWGHILEGKLRIRLNRRDFLRWFAMLLPFSQGAGFGSSRGATLNAEGTSPMTSIRVTNEPLCPGEINPYQYGQFIEYLCNLVPSMWAEKLYDGSFEGLSPYNFVYLKETDFKEKPWYPSGATNRAEYTLDHDTKVSGDVSQKIATVGDTPCTVGISQDGIAVQKGAACIISIYLRA